MDHVMQHVLDEYIVAKLARSLPEEDAVELYTLLRSDTPFTKRAVELFQEQCDAADRAVETASEADRLRYLLVRERISDIFSHYMAIRRSAGQ